MAASGDNISVLDFRIKSSFSREKYLWNLRPTFVVKLLKFNVEKY